MRLGMVTTYPPRRGPLSDPAGELVRGLSALQPEQRVETVVCAVDQHALNYPDEVVAVVNQDRPEDYRRAALVLTECGVDVAMVHFEAGLYGPSILDCVRELRRRDIPHVVSLHGLRPELDETTARTIAALTVGAARVQVRSSAARRLVTEQRLAPADIVTVMPAGVPAVVATAATRPEAASPALTRLLAELDGRRLVTTVGPLPGRQGTAAVLAALADHPDLHYVVAAHQADEAAVATLRALADGAGLGGRTHVVVDSYLAPVDLAALLGRTEIYLGANCVADRTCSGSLTYAVAAGCATVAPGHPYVVELLGSGAGILSADFAAGIATLLEEPGRLAAARRRATAMAAGLTCAGFGPRLATHLREAAGGVAAVPGVAASTARAAGAVAATPLLAGDEIVPVAELLSLAHRLLAGGEISPTLAARLDATWSTVTHAGWPWFGPRLGAGAALVHALLAAGRRLGDGGLVEHGLRSLHWYVERAGLAGADTVLRPPTSVVPEAEDAAALVETLVEASLATGSRHYLRLAQRALAWFAGANREGVTVFDPHQGTCRAGLAPGPASVPATLAYHAAARALESVHRPGTTRHREPALESRLS